MPKPVSHAEHERADLGIVAHYPNPKGKYWRREVQSDNQGPMCHTLRRVQRLGVSELEAWEFFSNPGNLVRITPPDLGFKIISDVPQKMYSGARITYRVTPLFGLPATWVTEITQVDEPRSFVDRQLKGPYRHWHHEHSFRPTVDGVEMEDLVHYSLPFGFLGRIANALVIRRRLKEIFDYRERALIEIFGQARSTT